MDYNKLIEDLITILSRFKQSLIDFLPNLIGAIIIFLLGFLVARITRALLIRLINKVHFIIPSQSIRNRVRSFIDEKPVNKIIGGIFYWIIIFSFLTAATETLGLPVVTTWLSGIAGYLPKILFASFIVIAGLICSVILRDFVTTAATSAGILYGTVLGKLAQVILILVTILIGVEQIGIDVTLLNSVIIIIIGALLLGAALAFGFGAKTSVKNILASYYLQKIYKVGDRVKIGDIEGRIIRITPLAVIMDSPHGQMCIPAKQFNQESSVLLSEDR
jgi:hypothetical protein